MSDYRIIPEERVIIQTFYGKISLKDLKELHLITKKDPLYSHDYSYVSDFRKADLVLTLEDIEIIGNYLIRNDHSKGKTAVLINRAIDTAKFILLGDRLKPKFNYSVFSTLEAVSVFLNVNLFPYISDDSFYREDLYIQSFM
jgi:hypothetical protein